MGAGEKKRPGLSKDSVPMAASFQNSLGMRHNENHRGGTRDPGSTFLTWGLAKSPAWAARGHLATLPPQPHWQGLGVGGKYSPSVGPSAKGFKKKQLQSTPTPMVPALHGETRKAR